MLRVTSRLKRVAPLNTVYAPTRTFFWSKKQKELEQPIVQPKKQHAPHSHPKPPQKSSIPGIKHIVVVASGKGGVGKSTVATNLALSFSRLNQSVGLLDADIYGPSIHKMMNVTGKPDIDPHGRLVPKSNYGIKVMSMGNIVPEDSPTIWRGPLVMGALNQLFRQVDWGELDILVIDFPPGTGDAQLTTAQSIDVTGAVIVSTPQDIALIDAKRGTNMFRKVGIPILGIIENMSFYKCTNCGHVDHIFGHHGAKDTAEEMNLDFLGEVPLNVIVRETSDSGKPIVISDTSHDTSKIFMSIAEKVLKKLQEQATGGPKIIIE
jgi:ATP-binding protein involved in chromosome partitioning